MTSLNELKQELIEYGKLCGVKNFTPGISGNLSVRYKNNILITVSGSANGYLSDNDFVLIDFDGNVVKGSKKASSEKMLHVEFYKKRPDINSILHVHSPYLSSFAACNIALDEPVMPENIFYFGQIPLAEYGLPSSKDLVDKTSLYFDNYDVVLMANHGVIVGGEDTKSAYLKLELAESYAQVLFNTKVLGAPVLLTSSQVAEINALKI